MAKAMVLKPPKTYALHRKGICSILQPFVFGSSVDNVNTVMYCIIPSYDLCHSLSPICMFFIDDGASLAMLVMAQHSVRQQCGGGEVVLQQQCDINTFVGAFTEFTRCVQLPGRSYGVQRPHKLLLAMLLRTFFVSKFPP